MTNTNVTIVWTLPVPSTALIYGVRFQQLQRRMCCLSFEYEEDDGLVKRSILFHEVQAFKCTYLKACTVFMIKMSYDKVVKLADSEWLSEVTRQVSQQDVIMKPLNHYMIYFDDGPCFEFVCTHFTLE